MGATEPTRLPIFIVVDVHLFFEKLLAPLYSMRWYFGQGGCANFDALPPLFPIDECH